MYVVTGEEMHQIDRFTMDEIGLSEETLMESAGQAFCREIMPNLTEQESLAILIGTGNNGGDGFVIGRILKEAGFDIEVIVIPPENKIRGTALKHKRIFENSGYEWVPFDSTFVSKIPSFSIIIDAMLGTGVKGKPRSPYLEIIETVNRSPSKVIAVDIPSGIPAQEGNGNVIGLKADKTYTFQAPKISQYLYPAAEFFGEVHVLDIGIPKLALENNVEKRKLMTEKRFKDTLVERRPDAHKGTAGKALIIGGSVSMTGAVVLSTEACLRSGAGLVTTAIPEDIRPIVAQKTTEAMFHALPSENGEMKIQLANFPQELSLHLFDAIAIGPGLGRKNQQHLFKAFKNYEGVLVIDADGLYHLAGEIKQWQGGREKGDTIITPHTGEMARLTGLTVSDIEKSRFTVSKNFAMKYGMYVVLKGPYTIITTPNGEQWVNQTGNASLAKGGSGDVLTGIILGFLLQHDTVGDAICNAVFIHGKTADELVKDHDIFSVTATDVVENLPMVLHSTRTRT